LAQPQLPIMQNTCTTVRYDAPSWDNACP